MTTTEEQFRSLINNKRQFIETLLVVENKQRQRVPFTYNTIQEDVDSTQTGMDIWVKPSSIGFSTERIANRLVDTLTNPGTNTVLVAFEDFITERLLSKVNFFYNHLESLQIPGFPIIHHNCLPYHSKIQLADGSFRQVGQIVNKRESVDVLSCNIDNGNIEPRRVVNWFKYPSNHKWIVLGSGHKFSHMMTSNHPIYTNSGWKTAHNVELGDTTWHNGFVPNDDQKQLILGSILGDGSLGERGVKFGQSIKEYAKFKYRMLKDESSDFCEYENHGYPGSTMLYTFSLRNCPYFESYNIDELDEKGLAIWYCDDGLFTINNSGGIVVGISTDCFDYPTQLYMKSVLMRKFGILSEVRKHGEYFHLTIPNPRGSGNHNKFFSMIAPYVPTCMEYKIPDSYKGRAKYQWNDIFNYGLVPYEIKVKDVALTNDRVYNYIYNIEVEDNHNYFTSIGLCKNSTYEKTFEFKVDGRTVSTSSIYIASARSKTAGRAEVIHHLLLDEHAFYVEQASENIIAPALARVPPEGTVDSFSTPNGEENEFHDWYVNAKTGKSLFTPHFYSWFMHKEYVIHLGDKRIKQSIPETDRNDFPLSAEEEKLMFTHELSFAQIRWRRWMIMVMETLRRKGESRTLFPQEFPEDDVTCFLTTGDMWYGVNWIESLTKTCYDAPHKMDGLNVWYRPETKEEGVPARQYYVIIDPGQGKITQSSIGVMTFKKDELGNDIPVWCARDAGWYEPEVTWEKALKISDYYHRATIIWEANAHGLAISVLAKNRRPVYFRKDIVSGVSTMVAGWLTTPSTKPYMLQQVEKYLPSLICHDIELVRQLSNFRVDKGKVVIVGLDDIHDTLAIGLAVFNPKPTKRGYQGRTGYSDNWGKKGKRKKHSIALRR